jgi:type 1 glutamine amidotransferase
MKHLPLRICLAALLAALMVVPMAHSQDKKLEGMFEKVAAALPEKPIVAPKSKHKILIYSKTAGFRHSSIPVGVKAISMMGDKTGVYSAYATEDPSIFEPEKLKTFDAVYMLNTTGDCLKPKSDDAAKKEEIYKKSLEDFVLSGKGLIGCHSATDTYHNWKAYNKMMGGTFNGHPWHQKVPIKVLEPQNPLCAMFGGKDFEIADEIYQFRLDTASPSDRLFLLALDIPKMTEKDVMKGNRKNEGPYAVSWVSTYGKGRTFYCSLGHREEIYWNPTILQHYLAGLQYVLGDLDAPSRPTQLSSTSK